MRLDEDVGVGIKKGKNITSSITKFFSDLPISIPVISSVSQGVSSVISYDYLSLVEVKNSIAKKDNTTIPFVLIFDDFERSSIPIIDRIGLLNNYIENKHIKTIVLADEDKIQDKNYCEFKEKVLSHTVHLMQDEESTIQEIINIYDGNEQYKEFLKLYSFYFIDAFIDSRYNNYRSFILCLHLFERLYNLCFNKYGDLANFLSYFIYSFCARVYEHRAGTLCLQEPFGWMFINSEYNSAEKIVEKYKKEFAFTNSFRSISKWIFDGIWDESEYLKELEQYFNPAPADKLINGPVWSIEQKDINGLNELLDKAYNGQLTRDELVSFICILRYIQDQGFDLPCRINYSTIENGYDLRVEREKKRGIVDAKTLPIPSIIHVNISCKSLIRKLNYSDKKIETLINKKSFLNFLRNENQGDGSELRNKYYEEFDKEMLDAFYTRYRQSDPKMRLNLATLLCCCIFDGVGYSDSSNIIITINNLEKLKVELRELINSESGSFSRDRIKYLVNGIENLQNDLKKI